MKLKDKIFDTINNEKKSYLIKRFLHSLFISIITLLLILKILKFVKEDVSTIFASDSFEFFIISASIYFIYFYISKQKNRFIILLLSLITIIPIIIMGYYKVIQTESNIIEYIKPEYAQLFSEDKLSNIIDVFINYIGISAITFSIILIISKLDYIFMKNYHELKKDLENVKKELLKQQFNPHFLYNALNSLYSMSLNNNPKTPETILKLSGMMRFLTDDLPKNEVPLNSEIQFIQEYIDLEKVRFGENNRINFTIKGNSRDTLIEPLILFPLVENAFKHGNIYNNQNAFISITLKIEEMLIDIVVSNSTTEKVSIDREGKGLYLLKSRLNLSYPSTSTLYTEKINNIYTAKLQLNI